MTKRLNSTYFGIFALAILAAMPFLMALANPPAVEPAKPVGRPSPSPTPPPTTYSGHIVYTANGTLHIFNLATNSDTSLGVSGSSPKFSLDGSKIVYQTAVSGSSTPPVPIPRSNFPRQAACRHSIQLARRSSMATTVSGG